MQSCWKSEPDKRPSFSELVSALTHTLEPLADYLDVSTFSTSEQPVASEMSKVVESSRPEKNCAEVIEKTDAITESVHTNGSLEPHVQARRASAEEEDVSK